MRGNASAHSHGSNGFDAGLALAATLLLPACSKEDEAHAADAAGVPEAPGAPGDMKDMRDGAAPAPEAKGFLAPPTVLEGLVVAAEPPIPTPPAPRSVPKPEPEPERASEPGAGAVRSADERALSAALLHAAPAAFEAELALHADLSATRKNMMLAFAAVLAGHGERAQELARGLEGADDVSAVEWALLTRALGGGDARAMEAGAPRGTAEPAFARAARLALVASQAQRDLAQGRAVEAARGFSEVLLGDLDSDWPKERAALRRWSEGLLRAQEGHRWNKRGAWTSVTVSVQPGDSLTTVRKRAIEDYAGLVTCTGLIERSNQLSSELDIHPGDELRIPTDEVHTRVYVAARWLLYLHGEEVVAAWSVGVGRPGEETPTGEFMIGPKQKEPVWFRPGHEPVAFGDPENPLGTRWLPWYSAGEKTGYGFHGTNQPEAVGGWVSQGCVRMQNEDVELLYEILPQGARVVVRP
jgi:hypothetical protein